MPGDRCFRCGTTSGPCERFKYHDKCCKCKGYSECRCESGKQAREAAARTSRQISEAIRKFPSVTGLGLSESILEVVRQLGPLGVNSEEDLKFVTSSDLRRTDLKPVSQHKLESLGRDLQQRQRQEREEESERERERERAREREREREQKEVLQNRIDTLMDERDALMDKRERLMQNYRTQDKFSSTDLQAAWIDVGDSVQSKRDSSKIGVVEKDDGSGHLQFTVKWYNGTVESCVGPKELILLTFINVGDSVQSKRDSSKIGVVEKDDGSGHLQFTVKWYNGAVESCVGPKELIKINRVTGIWECPQGSAPVTSRQFVMTHVDASASEVLQGNRCGDVVKLGGTNGGTGGFTGLSPDKIWYCGKWKNECRCGSCDGQCGPNDGCPCNACFELLQFHQQIHQQQPTQLLFQQMQQQMQQIQIRNASSNTSEFKGICAVCGSGVYSQQSRGKNPQGAYVHLNPQECVKTQTEQSGQIELKGICAVCGKGVFSHQGRTKNPQNAYVHLNPQECLPD